MDNRINALLKFIQLGRIFKTDKNILRCGVFFTKTTLGLFLNLKNNLVSEDIQ